ncbi:hypothetical protein D3C78_1461720 [compost metagenome]
MLGMQAGGRAVVLDAQPQLAALCIGQADQCLDQLAVGELLQVALELDGEGFAGRQALGHIRLPFVQQAAARIPAAG